ADCGSHQQNHVVVVSVVPEAGDPRGIGWTGMGQGRQQRDRAYHEQGQATPERHGDEIHCTTPRVKQSRRDDVWSSGNLAILAERRRLGYPSVTTLGVVAP